MRGEKCGDLRYSQNQASFIFLHTPTTLESAAPRDDSVNQRREHKIQ